MIEQLIVHDLDPLTLESVFPTPGRNELCHCNSGQKYKKCCLAADEEVWRAVAQISKTADAVLEMLRGMPRSIYPEYNP
jgi:SEC-C motif